eukprot:TRINITY_DN6671_c0_g1_i3.p1 TRINITY_DN6671_c0_g1~~TRINITY_DN6671_c0_g1_i3.p1  ORF type:complete len:214 (-),score=42.49 TRINITY_DN6671_c0_g1_i3:58-615(-)
MSTEDDWITCVLVGDSGCGKTAFLSTFIEGSFPVQDIPKLKEYVTKIGNHDFSINDTRNSFDEDRNRLLHYPRCKLVVVCFDMGSKASFEGLGKKWLSEISLHCESHPTIFLVGLKSEGNDEVTERDLLELVSSDSTYRNFYVVSAKNDPARTKEVWMEMLNIALQETQATKTPRPTRGRACNLF